MDRTTVFGTVDARSIRAGSTTKKILLNMKIVRFEDIPSESSHHGTVLRKALLRRPEVQSKLLGLNEAYLEPGQPVEPHAHTDAEEIFIVLKGKANMIVDGKNTILDERCLIVIAPTEKHELKHIGNEQLIFLTIMIEL